MLMFLPLISEAGADEYQIGADRIGDSVLVGTQMGETARHPTVNRDVEWLHIRTASGVGAALRVRTIVVSSQPACAGLTRFSSSIVASWRP